MHTMLIRMQLQNAIKDNVFNRCETCSRVPTEIFVFTLKTKKNQ